MLMATMIGIGLCASAYYIYRNQTNISLHFIRLSLKVEDYLLKYRGNINYYLVPNENLHCLNYSNSLNQCEIDNDKDILLRQAYNIDNKPCEYYIDITDIDKRCFSFVNLFSDNQQNFINDEFKNFKSPILSCMINITKNGDNIFKDYDLTKNINSFVNYNSEIILSNKETLKKLWIFYFNYIGKSNNSYISYDNINDIELEWTIMKDNLEIISGKEISIKTKNGKCEILKLD
jgi:hypothetical protein